MALLDSVNVIFYHPLGNVNESTQNQDWGTGGSTTGKVAAATSGISTGVFSFGTTTELDNMATTVQGASKMDMVSLSSTKVVAFYRDEDDSRTGKARVGTVSGNDITWSAAIAFSGTNMNRKFSALTMSTTTVLVMYRGLPTAVVGTVSGTDITFGTAVTVRAAGSTGGLTPYDSLDKISSTQAICTTGQIIGGFFTPHACVLTVSGSDVTAGTVVSYAGANDFNAFTNKCVLLSSTRAIVFYVDDADNTQIGSRVATISGTDITFGAVHAADLTSSINGDGNFSVTAIDATRFVVAAHLAAGAGEGMVGTVSGEDVTYGAASTFAADTGGNAANPRVRKIDSASVALAWGETGGGSPGGKTKVGTISGSDITWGTEAEWAATFVADSNGHPMGMAVLGTGTIAIAWYDKSGTVNYESVIGNVGFAATLTAPTPASYPSTIGDTHATVAFWANNPTSGSSTVTIERGYIITMTATSITLGGTTATWDDAAIGTFMTSLNDGSPHFAVLDFEHTGGTSWNLRTSVDGAAFTDQGAQNSGTQSVTTADTDPELDISGDADQWVDELVMWSGNTQFTSAQLDELYDLANDFGDGMDNYSLRYLTISVASDPTGTSVTATTDRDGNGNGVAPFNRNYAADTEITLTAPATSSNRPFLEWRNIAGDILSSTTTLTVTLALDGDDTYTAFYLFQGDTLNDYQVASP